MNDTAYAQSSIVAASLMILEGLKSKGIKPDVCAGLSLGEYSALCCAGSMDAQTAINIVRQRGILMSNALPQNTTGMRAVLGLDAGKIQEVCKEVNEKGWFLKWPIITVQGKLLLPGK